MAKSAKARKGGKKSAGKRSAGKKSAGKKRAGKRRASARGQATKVLASKSSVKGKSYDPSGIEPAARAAAPQVKRPRPARTRYPISMETFFKLKKKAETSKTGSMAKKASTIIRDKGRPTAARARAVGIAEPGVPLAKAPAAKAPTQLVSFTGIRATGLIPPDCTLAAGPNQVLASVNTRVALYNKSTGAQVLAKSLDSWFSNVISGAQIFDPKALYDQHSGRWVLVALAIGPGVKDSFFLLSVSKTSDPTAGWFNYKMDATKDGNVQTNNWADFPGVGVDNQAIYLTANMFEFEGEFQYSKIRIIPKAKAYANQPFTFKDIPRLKDSNGQMSFTVQPCHTFGAPDIQYFVNSLFPFTAAPAKALTLWSLKNPLTNPTLTGKKITVSPFTFPPFAAQKGNNEPLDSGDVRVLNAVYRGGSVWCALTTAHNFGPGNVAAIQWFQINATSGTLTQQGVYGAGNSHCFYPAVMPDSNGNMIMVFSRCSPTEFASIRQTGRKSTDPLGSLQGSALFKAGTANYVAIDSNGLNRWGDYAGIGADPSDPLRVWFYSLYAVANNTWLTQIGAAKF